jgi:hypothetical protein
MSSSSNGIVIGTPTYTTSAPGFSQALVTSDGNYVEIPPSACPDLSSDWSMRCRILTVDQTDFSGMLSVGDTSGQNSFVFIGVRAGTAVAFYSFGDVMIQSSVEISDGQWHDMELCCQFVDGVCNVYFFIDGVLIGTDAGPYTPPADLQAVIGDIGGYLGQGYSFNGLIDEVGFYDVALHTSSFTPPSQPTSRFTSGLTVLYHFDGNTFDALVPVNIGSFGTITIQRNVPVVGGFIRVAPDFSKDRTKTSIQSALGVSGTKLIRLLPSGGASSAGGKYGAQELIVLPPVSVSSSVDPAYNQLIGL